MSRSALTRVCLPVCLSLLLTSFSPPTPANLYEFHIDGENLNGAPASNLNTPIDGPEDRIVVRDGHFYVRGPQEWSINDDRRIRFWATNLGAPLIFPRTDAEAQNIASRLSKLGFNLVRLVGLDTPEIIKYDENGQRIDYQYETLLEDGSDYPTFDPDNLLALDRLLTAFAAEGIYVSLIIKLAYKFETSDCYTDTLGNIKCPKNPNTDVPGYPPSQGMPAASKPLDLFDPVLIELQKHFADQLLTRYKDNPVVALIEINNENSLVEHFHATADEFAANFPPLYAQELDGQWNQWLNTQYASTADLEAAWAPSGSQSGNVLQNGDLVDDAPDNIPDHWALHESTGCGPNDPQRVWADMTTELPSLVRFELVELPCAAHHLVFYQFAPVDPDTGYAAQAGQTYQLNFTAAVANSQNRPRKVKITWQSHDDVNYTILGTQTFELDTTLQNYSFCFTAPIDSASARVNFLPVADLNESLIPGEAIIVDDISLTQQVAVGLYEGETLEAGNVSPPPRDTGTCPASEPWKADYLEFLFDTESNYYTGMRDYLKNTLGVKQPITGSQANYGGLLGNRIAASMDYADVHFYWDHPKIPPDDQNQWTMSNTPMVDDPANGVVAIVSQARVAGKPFTISEYSPNQNNQYAQEALAMMAAYAALQDIDAVFMFNYFRTGGDYRDMVYGSDTRPTRLRGYYNILGETRSEAAMHLAANIFRRSDATEALNTLQVHISQQAARDQMRIGVDRRNMRNWLSSNITDTQNAPYNVLHGLGSAMSLVHTEAAQSVAFPQLPTAGPDPVTGGDLTQYPSDNGELLWAHSAAQAPDYPLGFSDFSVDTDRTKVYTGHIGGKSQALSGVTLSGDGASMTQFGTVALTAVDHRPVLMSNEMLLTSLGRGSNVNLGLLELSTDRYQNCVIQNDACAYQFWDANAGNFGIEANAASVRLGGAASSLRVERLSTQGDCIQVNGACQEVAVTEASDGSYFEFSVGNSNDQTPWYRVVATLPPAVTIEAESATAITGTSPGLNGVVNDADSSGGAYVQLVLAGKATLDIPATLTPGQYYLEIAARADEHDGPPELDIAVGGVTLKTVRVPDAQNGIWQRFAAADVPVDLSNPSTLEMDIEFVNDAWTAGVGNRNVYIDYVRLYPADTRPNADWDGDGIPNGQDSDDDNDGLSDSAEWSIGTSPYQTDTDGDGVSDFEEHGSAAGAT